MFWTCGTWYDGSVYKMSASITTNGGTNWTRYNFGGYQGMTYTIVMDPADNNVLYVGGYENTGSYGPAIYKTTDQGSNWNKLAGTGLAGYVYALVVDPNNSNILFAGTSSSLFKSADGGNTWTTIGFTGGRTQALAVLVTARATTFYAGTYSNGVYCSTDNGASWAQMNDGLEDRNINCLETSSNLYLFAGTNGGSVYRYLLPVGAQETPGNDNVLKQPVALLITPNPSSGKTMISYQVPVSSNIEISLYDVQGRCVITIEKTPAAMGTKTISWDGYDTNGRPVPAGVYFCKLITDTQVCVEKLVILR